MLRFPNRLLAYLMNYCQTSAPFQRTFYRLCLLITGFCVSYTSAITSSAINEKIAIGIPTSRTSPFILLSSPPMQVLSFGEPIIMLLLNQYSQAETRYMPDIGDTHRSASDEKEWIMFCTIDHVIIDFINEFHSILDFYTNQTILFFVAWNASCAKSPEPFGTHL